MKILLVVPRFVGSYGEHYVFPIGMAYVSSALKRAGHSVECLNLNNVKESYLASLVDCLQTIRPDVVGCGGLSVHFLKIKEVFETARLIIPDAFLVAGGGIISSEPELMLTGLEVDAGVIGEGEITVVNLISALVASQPLNTVNGIVYRDNDNRVCITPEAEPILNLDELAWPDYEGFGFEEFLSFQRTTDDYFYHTTEAPRSLDIISSRSCPFDCSFCFHPLGRVYRKRSLDSFFAELDFVVSRYRINRLAVLDELFAVDKDRLIEFCRRIKSYKIKWMAQLRVDLVDTETLALMFESNCQVISYGIESACDEVLAGMKKKITRKQIDAALYKSYVNRVGIQGNLIFGDTSETYETILESLDWWRENRRYGLWLSSIQHYPGTKIYQDGIRQGAIPDRMLYHEQGCPQINTTSIQYDKYNEMLSEIQFINLVTSYPGYLLRFEKLPKDDLLRGPVYSSSCICPHCGNIDEHAYITNYGTGRPVQRITCNYCQQRYDIPYTLNNYISTLGEKLYAVAQHRLNNGDITGAYRVIVFGISHENKNAYLHYLLGKIFFSYDNVDQARIFFRNALLLNCLDESFHTAYAELQQRLGQAVIGRIFDDQAKLIRMSKKLQVLRNNTVNN